MTAEALAFRPLHDAELARANQRYAELAFAPSRPDQDHTFGAFLGDELVALGRINAYADGGLEVGGFWIAEPHRGRGLARHMVAYVLGEVPRGQRCYCIPFAYLASFYQRFGMTEVPLDDQVPSSIRAKLDLCRAREAEGRYAPTVLLAFRT